MPTAAMYSDGAQLLSCLVTASTQWGRLMKENKATFTLSLQISPTRCTILLNIFISLLYMFRASMWPPSGKNYCIYSTLVFVTLYGWRPVCWLDWPIQGDIYQCHIDTVIFSWWWAHGCPKHVEKRNKYIKQSCAPSWTYLQRLFRDARSTKHKIQHTRLQSEHQKHSSENATKIYEA